MRERNKRNIVIGILCVMVVFMSVGYAVLSQNLNINGTANITGSWKIEITDISPEEINEGVSVSTSIADSKVAGSFEANLKKPTDAVIYTVTVENKGTIDAVLESITPEDYSQGDIKYTTTGKEDCKNLDAGSSCNFTIKVEYLDTGVGQVPTPNGTKVEQQFEIKYVQEGANINTPGGEAGGEIDEPAIIVDSNGLVTGYNKAKLTNDEGYVVIPATTEDGEKIVSVDRGSFVDYNVKMAYVYNETTDEEIEAYVIYDEENYEEIKSILSSEMEDEGSGSGSYSSNSYVLHKDINPTNLTTKHNKKITLEKLSGSGSGSSEPPKIYSKTEFEALLKEISSTGEIQTEYEYMYVNMETGEIDEELVSSIEKLDLTNALYLENVGMDAFADSPLKEVKLPEGIQEIGENAFGNTLLTSVVIPSSVKVINSGAFSSCELLTKVTLSEGLETIGDQAFQHSGITGTLILPSTLKLIDYFAFIDNKIEKVLFSDESQLTTIGNYAFSNNKLSEIVIPQSVTTIANAAFADNDLTMTKITIKRTDLTGTNFESEWNRRGWGISPDFYEVEYNPNYTG